MRGVRALTTEERIVSKNFILGLSRLRERRAHAVGTFKIALADAARSDPRRLLVGGLLADARIVSGGPRDVARSDPLSTT